MSETENTNDESGELRYPIDHNRVAHMVGVAEWMHEHAEEFGRLNRNQMYLLGLIHDIGYLQGAENHDVNGAGIIGLHTYYGQLVVNHTLTPKQYMRLCECTEAEIPAELALLWAADMSVDLNGNAVGFERRLFDIGDRHGFESKEYKNCCETVNWLKTKLEAGNGNYAVAQARMANEVDMVGDMLKKERASGEVGSAQILIRAIVREELKRYLGSGPRSEEKQQL